MISACLFNKNIRHKVANTYFSIQNIPIFAILLVKIIIQEL